LSKFKKIDLTKVRTYKIAERKSRADIESMGKPFDPDPSFQRFLRTLPDYLKANDLMHVAEAIAAAKVEGRKIIWMMGAHPIKVGLSAIIVDLARRGFVSHLALNGAGAIHDVEMSFFGKTSEEVADGIGDGSFGMTEETPRLIFEAVKIAGRDELGLGEGIGKYILGRLPKYANDSILATCFSMDIPATIHVAIGSDTIVQHPGFDGAIFGKLSHDDFLIFSESLKELSDGVILNIGSAVILPEVFLKGLTVARNVYGRVENFTAVNFDMIQHYRPNTNVVIRPVAESGKGYSITGHHEIMIPLLAAAIKTKFMEISGRE